MRANKNKRRVPLYRYRVIWTGTPQSNRDIRFSLWELLLLLIPPSHLRKFNKKKTTTSVFDAAQHSSEQPKQNHHFRLIVFLRIMFNCVWKGLGKKIKKKTKNKLFLNICENCKWWRFSFIPIRIWRCCVVVHDCNRTIMITFQCL